MKISLPTITSIALLAAPAVAQGILPYLPKKTMMAVSAPDLSMSVAEFQQMPMAKMWAEEEVQTFVADVRDMALGYLDEGIAQAKQMHAQGALPVDPDDLMKLRVAGATFAITGLDLAMGDFGPMPKFGLVLHLDFGDAAGTWNKLVQTGLGMLEQEAGDDLAKTETMVGDVKMISLQPQDITGMEMGLNVAMIPGGMLIGTLAEDVRSIVDNMQNKTAALSTAASYQAVTSRLTTSGAECEVFVSPDPAMDFAMSALRMAVEHEDELAMIDMDGVERAMQAMGLRNLGSMGMTMTYENGKSVTRAFEARGANAGATAAVNNIDTSFLKWVPKDAVGFGAGTMDVSSIYDTVLKGLQAYNPEVADQALAQLAKMEEQLGFSVRNDLFGSLGDHYITWSMPMGTISSAPEDRDAAQDQQRGEARQRPQEPDSALTQGMVEIEEGTKRGVKVLSAVQVNIDSMRRHGRHQHRSTCSSRRSRSRTATWWLGFSASDVKRVFKRMDRETTTRRVTSAATSEFMAVADSIPQGVTRASSFTDWKAELREHVSARAPASWPSSRCRRTSRSTCRCSPTRKP